VQRAQPGEQDAEPARRDAGLGHTPKLGAAFEPEHVDCPTPWWREVLSRRERAKLELAPGKT